MPHLIRAVKDMTSSDAHAAATRNPPSPLQSIILPTGTRSDGRLDQHIRIPGVHVERVTQQLSDARRDRASAIAGTEVAALCESEIKFRCL